MKMVKTKVAAIKCYKCGDIIYSRARHDYHSCSCEEIAIDGGFDYVRMNFKTKTPKIVTKHISASKQELFDDWNNNIDKFGIIRDNLQ